MKWDQEVESNLCNCDVIPNLRPKHAVGRRWRSTLTEKASKPLSMQRGAVEGSDQWILHGSGLVHPNGFLTKITARRRSRDLQGGAFWMATADHPNTLSALSENLHSRPLVMFCRAGSMIYNTNPHV